MEGNFDTLPSDALRKIALKLSYVDLSSYKGTSKKLAAILRDPYFWRERLNRDFPGLDISDILEFRPFNMREYLNHLKLKAYRHKDLYKQDPIYIRLDEEYKKLAEEFMSLLMARRYVEVNILNIENRRLSKELKNIRKSYEAEASKQQELIEEVEKLVKPPVGTGVYETYRLSSESIDYLFEILSQHRLSDADVLADYLYTEGYINKRYDPQEYAIIKIPDGFYIYVYYDRKKDIRDYQVFYPEIYPSKLIIDIFENDWDVGNRFFNANLEQPTITPEFYEQAKKSFSKYQQLNYPQIIKVNGKYVDILKEEEVEEEIEEEEENEEEEIEEEEF